MSLRPIPARAFEKVWGRQGLPREFAADPAARIGEIWFDPPPPPLARQLVKYLFTSEKLSVQVHPAGDARGVGGKDECWLVTAAGPEARLAIGLAEPVDTATLRAAALDGSIDGLLVWHTPKVGEFFSIPAGTIHAIGPGITLIEVQQNCDITYRLYDYGRPRELHLEAAVAAARAGPWAADALRRTVAPGETATLLEGPHFRVGHVAGGALGALGPRWRGPVQVVPLAGEVAGEGPDGARVAIAPGGCGWCEDLAALDLPADGRVLVAQPVSE